MAKINQIEVNGTTYDIEDSNAFPLISGGTQGQVLTKVSSVDGDADWENVSGLPDGGTLGQVLTKLSSADGDADWQNPSGGSVPAGGTTGQVLTKYSNNDGEADWENIPSDSSKMNLVSTPTDGDILVTNSSGQAVDSGVALSSIGGTNIYDGDDNTDPKYSELFLTDVASGVDTVKVGLDMDLLWENANPTATFAGQTIQLNTSDYGTLRFLVLVSPEDADYIYYDATNDGKHFLFDSIFRSYLVQRDVMATQSSIVFTDCYLASAFGSTRGSANNNYLRPYQIYGIRGQINDLTGD